VKLYDFSLYAEKRKERDAAKAVAEVVAECNKPGAVIELKHRVQDWFSLHQEVLKHRYH
jgi:hypothetical protein